MKLKHRKKRKHEKRCKQHAFDCFCKKVLRNDVRNYYREIKRLRKHEVSFSDLTVRELGELHTIDEYFSTDQIFNVCGNDIIVNNDEIATALHSISEFKRNVILLSFFLEMTDIQIGKVLKLKRSTVQYRRVRALKELRRLMEDSAYD
jgi:RNA polymerase sigma factor (sigma-70 family)